MDKSCIKCGRCLAVCPVYKVSGQERLAPRGKLNLIDFYKNKKISASPLFQEAISACILCRRCEERCILNISTPDIIHQLRQELWPQQKIRLYRSWLANKFLASYPKHLGIWLRLFALLQQIVTLPISLSSHPFLRQKITFHSIAKSKGTVAIFVGCGVNLIYPHLGHKLVKLCQQLGFNVIIPAGQSCCGLMAHTLGDEETASSLAYENVKAFSDINPDIIITPCASCYHQLKTFSVYQEAGLSAKVIELSQFLQDKTLSFMDLDAKITWHDPCHLRFHHNIWQEPRDLLKKAGYHFIETSPEGMCCGHGGSFALNFPDLSKDILNKRKAVITSSQAEITLTSCMGCLIQLKMGLGEVHVKHILEIFA
ncbi:MAG: (Fe-S)-binding protein [Candidatus Desulfofervidaceae bacterium]|nr:(Fe-S)-binding protein [Candidatus Desulfofervidaceae bacterium]